MNMLFALWGPKYHTDEIASPEEVKKTLLKYEEMRTQGLHARLIIRRDNGKLSLIIKEKHELSFLEKAKNFFLGTYTLSNVQTVVERALGLLHQPIDDSSKKLEHAIALLNEQLLPRYGTKIHALNQRSFKPLSHLDKIKNKQQEQLQIFEHFAATNQWIRFRPEYSHYDWWAFPLTVTYPGATPTALEYSVTKEEIQELKKDPEFMKRYRRGVDLVVQSWGWDLAKDGPIPADQRKPDQAWTGYAIRLGKMMNSLRFFGEKDLFLRLKHFFDAVGHEGVSEDWIIQGFSGEGRPSW